MTKNPFINAASASVYIFLVVWVMNVVTRPLANKPDTFFAPVLVLFMLTLSVTVMAFVFFYQPLQLFIEGKKKVALTLFVQTVGIFALITGVVLGLFLTGLL